jgi:high-affinity K+ transport system ATPase subunit B
MVFSLLFTPLGRYILIGGLVVIALGGVYYKIRADAVAEIQAAATADALRRTQDAIRAGDAVDTSPNGLLKSDGHRRD